LGKKRTFKKRPAAIKVDETIIDTDSEVSEAFSPDPIRIHDSSASSDFSSILKFSEKSRYGSMKLPKPKKKVRINLAANDRV